MQVLREAGVNNDWRLCTEIRPGDQSRVTDVDSYLYATKYNPVYTLLSGGKVSVFPAPSTDPDTFKLYYINNVPVDTTNGADLAYNHNDINFFPKERVYMVPLYAAIRLIQKELASKTLPDYTAPVLSLDFTDYDAAYTKLTVFIETDEHTELAQAQLGKINAELSKISTRVQEYTNRVQEETSSLGVKIQKLSTDYQWLQSRYQMLKQEYDQCFMMTGPPKGQ